MECISNKVQDLDSSVTVGMAVVSQGNMIIIMRETLWLLLCNYSQSPDKIACSALVNILGNFAHQDVKTSSLKCILEPFMISASKPWLEQPVGAQKDAFEETTGWQLIQCLPPIPLALMFVMALLEQKIILTNTHRSVLLSATVALNELLKPLKWCHLLVSWVPLALAGDLLQYLAPFILGMPSEDPGNMDLICELPEDVTLVDLDVGCIILAPSFAHDSELGQGMQNNAETS